MRKLSFFIVLFLILINISGCKNQELMNQWKPNELKIDGSDADWQNVPLFMDEDMNIAFGSANDDENEYLIIKIGDVQLARRIQRMGVTVWLSREGKKEKRFGIRYIGSESLAASLRRNLNPEGQQPALSRMKKFKKTDLPRFGMIGILHDGKYRTEPENNPWGPSAASQEVNGLFCYEFKIPLQFGMSVTGDADEEILDDIKIGIEIGGITQEMREAMRENVAEMRDRKEGMRGMEGGRGGGMGGRGRMGKSGAGMGSDMSGLEGKEFWLDIKLAEK
ncbi:hypothetical protein B6D60_04340 [candidate division KSB1 bacterium 4484_87]|nr:MAG: hypothetical protein B6D60_04340 [candidate division KSB1 bacterium 4484_87]